MALRPVGRYRRRRRLASVNAACKRRVMISGRATTSSSLPRGPAEAWKSWRWKSRPRWARCASSVAENEDARSRASAARPGYLISEPPGVLFVGRARRPGSGVITGGIDLLDESRPISRPVTSVIARIVDLSRSRAGDDSDEPRATFAFATVRRSRPRV